MDGGENKGEGRKDGLDESVAAIEAKTMQAPS